MSCKVLVVEDEILIALGIESILLELGHQPVGIAADKKRAMELSPAADLALVDLNLADGPTGIDIGRRLASQGTAVLYMTSEPGKLGDGVPGTIGVIGKPVNEAELRDVVAFAVSIKRKTGGVSPPRRLRLFNPPAQQSSPALA